MKPKTLDQLRADKERAETQLAQEQHRQEHHKNRKHRCGNCHTDAFCLMDTALFGRGAACVLRWLCARCGG